MPEPTPNQQPAPPKPKQPEIHVMPEQFQGAALAYREEKKPPAFEAPRQAGAPAAPKAPGAPSKKPPLVLFIAIGAVVLAALGVGGYFLLRPKPAPTPKAPVAKPANKPANVNKPANANANAPATTTPPTNANANVPAPTPPPPTPLRSSADADVDGLTDTEERLYGTGITRPDTDGDGFLDGNEVFHLYNPAALAPTTLRDSGLVRIHEDTTLGYEILYPAAWTRRVVDQTTGAVTFTASSGEFVQVLVEANPQAAPIMDWYRARSPGVSSSQLETITTKGGYQALRSPDRLTTYIAKGTRVYVIAYNIGNLPEVSYRQTYEMTVNSFRIMDVIPAPPPAETSTSTATSTP